MAVSATRTLAIATTVADLRARVAAWKAEGLTVALVPTMGALHDGHLSLIRMAKTVADRVVVSVFVNPTQFGPTEDFDAYPRPLDEDRHKCGAAGAHLLYAPLVSEMYPDGFSTSITVSGVSAGLCGDKRPGHFAGVATVVCKLLLQALPDAAVFGEKDYQQVMVIRRMVRDLNIPVTIVGAPIVREADGLAMSSRNTYLTADERGRANCLYRTLHQAGQNIIAGMAVPEALTAASAALVAAGFGDLDYLELRDAATLEPMTAFDRPARLFVAVFLGTTRLIDNLPIEPG